MMEAMLKDVYTVSICKVTKVNADNSFLEVLCIATKTIITDVPLMQLGNKTINIKIKIAVGDLIPVFHVKEDVSLLISQGTEEPNNALDDFSQSNAIALPFKLSNFQEGFKMPIVDFEILGNIKMKGNFEIEGDIKQTGKLEATGEIKSDTDVKASTISLKTHKHPYTWTDGGGAGNTSPPT